jgi:Flp pilus assembly protein TadD
MIIRAKTKRRLFILVGGFLLVSVGLATLYAVRTRQVHRELMERRVRGIAAFQRGEYPAALSALAKYVARYPNDGEAVFHLAQARYKVEVPDGGHIQQAIHYFRRAADLQPDNLDAMRLLLDAYLKLGYHSEAVDAAEQLLTKAPQDTAAMRALAVGYAGKRAYDKALTNAEQYTERVPADFQLQRHTLGLYAQHGKVAQMIPRASKLLEQHPDDGKFELLLAIAYNTVADWTAEDRAYARRLVQRLDPQAKVDSLERTDAARFLIKRASQHISPDTYFVQILIAELDNIGMSGDAISLLQRAGLNQGDPSLRRILVRRLWEAGRYDEVNRATESIDPGAADNDPEAIGLRAMSLVRLGREDDARKLAEALEKRSDDRHAVAWGAVIRHIFLTPPGAGMSGGNDGGALACAQVIHEALATRRGGGVLAHARVGLGEEEA